MHGNPARDPGGSVGLVFVLVFTFGVMIVLVAILMIASVFVLLVLSVLGGVGGVRIGGGNGHARPAENGDTGSSDSDQFAHQGFLVVNSVMRLFSADVKMVAQAIIRL